MKRNNIYLKAAKRITADYNCGCCLRISELESYEAYHKILFTLKFRPTLAERRKYKVMDKFWMFSNDDSFEQNKNSRILALLFMDLIINESETVKALPFGEGLGGAS